MIGAICGQLRIMVNNTGLIQTKSGISFWVKLPVKLIDKIKVNDNINLITYLHVSENDFSLFGFENYDQYHWFRLLLTVDSIGPKIAYSIINSASIETIIKAVREKNMDFFNEIPGIGKKTAARLILELGNRLDKEISLDFINLSADDKLLIEALKQLGFTQNKINKILNKVPKTKPIEQRLKIALKLLNDDK